MDFLKGTSALKVERGTNLLFSPKLYQNEENWTEGTRHYDQKDVRMHSHYLNNLTKRKKFKI